MTRWRTWHAEAVVVGVALAVVAIVSGRPIEAVGSLAVWLSFLYAQVADRLAEREASRSVPAVHCHAWAGRYFVAREALWFAYFATTRAWSALVGVFLFLAYPAWRRWWRARHPLEAAP